MSATGHQPTAVTIGTFDGVHAGHRAILERARQAVGTGGRVVALAFDPHPRAVLRPGSEPGLLTTMPDRARLLTEAGADLVRRLDPASGLLNLTPEKFIRHVMTDFAPAVLIEGADFRFGKGRGGDPETLTELGAELGFEVIIVPDAEVPLADQVVRRASSTLVRDCLRAGRVSDAHTVLGRPYTLQSPVVPGDRIGRTIGVPTANINPATMLPADGVYAAAATLPSGDRLPAAMNIGTRPTVNGTQQRCEAHILGLPTSLGSESDHTWTTLTGLPEYGWTLRLEPMAWLRDQVRFSSINALAEQLARDAARAQRLFDDQTAGAAV